MSSRVGNSAHVMQQRCPIGIRPVNGGRTCASDGQDQATKRHIQRSESSYWTPDARIPDTVAGGLTCKRDEFIIGYMGLIQIRNVPDDVHRTLKARAAADGASLSDYILREVERLARTPTPAELDAHIATRGPAGVSTTDILEARDSGRRG